VNENAISNCCYGDHPKALARVIESQPEQEHVGKNAATKAFIPSIFACRCPGSVGPFLSFIILCKKKTSKKRRVFFVFGLAAIRARPFTLDKMSLLLTRLD
jgi:hypothetical protein